MRNNAVKNILLFGYFKTLASHTYFKSNLSCSKHRKQHRSQFSKETGHHFEIIDLMYTRMMPPGQKVKPNMTNMEAILVVNFRLLFGQLAISFCILRNDNTRSKSETKHDRYGSHFNCQFQFPTQSTGYKVQSLLITS